MNDAGKDSSISYAFEKNSIFDENIKIIENINLLIKSLLVEEKSIVADENLDELFQKYFSLFEQIKRS